MARYEDLEELMNRCKESHGHKYLVFIAPALVGKWDTLNVLSSDGTVVSKELLIGRSDLDLFFVEHSSVKGIKDGDLFAPHRFGADGIPER